MAPSTILVINPGSTSTKIALFTGDEKVFEEDVVHPEEVLRKFRDIPSQLAFRMETLTGRPAAKGGGYLETGRRGGARRADAARQKRSLPGDGGDGGGRKEFEDPLGPGARLEPRGYDGASAGSKEYGIPAFTADPVTVDEMDDIARISGVPEIKRRSLLHALNIKERITPRVAGFGAESR